MLIAIMGDTFDRVIDQRPTYSLKNKLMLMASMRSIIYAKDYANDDHFYMYVIKPSETDDGLG